MYPFVSKQVMTKATTKKLFTTPGSCAVWLALLLAAVPCWAAALDVPDAGKASKELNKPQLSQPQKNSADIILKEPEKQGQTDNGLRFPVNKFYLTGELPVSESQLEPLLQGYRNKELTLGDLNGLADRISTYLHEQGYLIALAYIPTQNIENGTVNIAVIPGKYGNITINTNNLIHKDKINGLHSLKSGDIITQAALTRLLLLLNDFAGLHVKAVLSPGRQAGTSDLSIDFAESAKTNEILYADNYGNRLIGRNRLGFVVNRNNPLGQGDVLTLSGITTGSGFENYGLAYQLPVGRCIIGANYAHTYYALGKEFAILNASGTADTGGVFLSYPLLRSYTANLTGSIGYEHKRLVDDSTATSSHLHKQLNNWNISLSGNWQEQNQAYTNYSLTTTFGQLGFVSAADSDYDALSAKTQGSYRKTVFVIKRRQPLSPRLSLNLSFNGQYAGKNLDSSEKFSLGGIAGVRAYPQGEASGDQGYLVNGEAVWQLPVKDSQNTLALAVFYDQGGITINKNAWQGLTGSNHQTLSGAGLGLMFSRDREYSLRLDYAWKTSAKAADTDQNGRLWLQGIKYF